MLNLKIKLLVSILAFNLLSPVFAQPVKTQAFVESRTFDLPKSSFAGDVQAVSSRLFVTGYKSKSLMVLNGADGVLQNTLKLPEQPLLLAYHDPSRRLYVGSANSPSLYVVNPESFTIVRTIVLPRNTRPAEIVFSANGTTAFVADLANPRLLVVDLEKGVVTRQIPLSSEIFSLEIDEAGGCIYAGSYGHDNLPEEGQAEKPPILSTIDCVDLKTLRRLSTVRMKGNSIVGLTLEKSGHLFAVCGGEIAKVEFWPQGGRISTSVRLNSLGFDVLYDPEQKALYLTSIQTLNLVDTQTLRIMKSAPSFAAYFSGITNVEGKRHLYLTNEILDSVSDFVLFPDADNSTATGQPKYLRATMRPLPKMAENAGNITLLPGGNFCFAASNPDGLGFLSRTDLKPLNRVPMLYSVLPVTLNPVLPELYASVMEEPVIHVFNLKTKKFVRKIRIPTGLAYLRMGVAKDGKKAFVIDRLKKVLYVVNLAEGKVLKQIALSGKPEQLVLAESVGKLYIPLEQPEDVTPLKNRKPPIFRIDVIDLATEKRNETIAFEGEEVASLSVDSVSRTLFVLSVTEGMLRAFTIGKKHELKPSPLPAQMAGDQGPRGNGLLFDEKSGYLYVSSSGANSNWISVVEPNTFKVVGKLSGGDGNMALWHSPNGKESILYTRSRSGLIEVEIAP